MKAPVQLTPTRTHTRTHTRTRARTHTHTHTKFDCARDHTGKNTTRLKDSDATPPVTYSKKCKTPPHNNKSPLPFHACTCRHCPRMMKSFACGN
jgi:hypothetical protein